MLYIRASRLPKQMPHYSFFFEKKKNPTKANKNKRNLEYRN